MRTVTGSALDPTALREEVRRLRSGRALAVLDDDPTGSQSVHGVQVVTVPERDEIAAALVAPPSVAFILTNTRGLPEAAAVDLTARLAVELDAIERELGRPVDVVSRSDSTLRGHVLPEIRALTRVRRESAGAGYDAVLFAPAFFEAGRRTRGGIHYVRSGDRDVPVGETEFARDATFGFEASALAEFLVERSDGELDVRDVRSITLEDIRVGGADRVAELIAEVSDGAFIVVNGEADEDFDVVALGAARATESGQRLLYRTGPSFVRALAGLEPSRPLTGAELWPDGPPTRHGLVVVGSHVSRTSAQLEVLRQRGGLTELEFDVGRAADPTTREAVVAETAEAIEHSLADADTVVYTSRTFVPGVDARTSLEIARSVSDALTEVVARAMSARPAWVVAKGGITSHDVAVTGLGIRRAEVLGQLGHGIISVLRPETARPEALGVPYVVFAGNVGDDDSLADAVDRMRGTR